MITKEELQEFHEFAGERLDQNGRQSLHDLVTEWESSRRHEQSVAAIRESVADLNAGRTVSVDEAFAEAERQLDADS